MNLIETNEIFAELEVENYFEIRPFESIVKKEDNKIEIPNDLIVNLTSVVIGTIRGILYEKLKGTPLQNEVYPLVNTEDIMKVNQNNSNL